MRIRPLQNRALLALLFLFLAGLPVAAAWLARELQRPPTLPPAGDAAAAASLTVRLLDETAEPLAGWSLVAAYPPGGAARPLAASTENPAVLRLPPGDYLLQASRERRGELFTARYPGIRVPRPEAAPLALTVAPGRLRVRVELAPGRQYAGPYRRELRLYAGADEELGAPLQRRADGAGEFAVPPGRYHVEAICHTPLGAVRGAARDIAVGGGETVDAAVVLEAGALVLQPQLSDRVPLPESVPLGVTVQAVKPAGGEGGETMRLTWEGGRRGPLYLPAGSYRVTLAARTPAGEASGSAGTLRLWAGRVLRLAVNLPAARLRIDPELQSGTVRTVLASCRVRLPDVAAREVPAIEGLSWFVLPAGRHRLVVSGRLQSGAALPGMETTVDLRAGESRTVALAAALGILEIRLFTPDGPVRADLPRAYRVQRRTAEGWEEAGELRRQRDATLLLPGGVYRVTARATLDGAPRTARLSRARVIPGRRTVKGVVLTDEAEPPAP